MNNQSSEDTQPEPVTEQGTDSKTNFRPVLWLLLFMLLILLSGGGYLGVQAWSEIQAALQQTQALIDQTRQQQEAIRQKIQETQQHLARQQSLIDQQNQRLQSQDQSMADEQRRIEQQRDALDQSMAKLNRRIGGGDDQWRVEEAGYLIKLANHRLNLMHDPATSKAALGDAKQRLADTGDDKWQPLMTQLGDEISLLADYSPIDINKTNLELNNLIATVEQLAPAQHQFSDEQPTSTQVEGEAQTEGLMRVWADFIAGLKSLVVIRQHQDHIEPLLSPGQVKFFRLNIQLQLQTAKLALAMGDLEGFTASITLCENWIIARMEPTDPHTTEILTRLAALKSAAVAINHPDISQSSKMFEQIISLTAIEPE